MYSLFAVMFAVGLGVAVYAFMSSRQPRTVYAAREEDVFEAAYRKRASGWFAGWESRWNRSGGTMKNPRLPGYVMFFAPLGVSLLLTLITNNFIVGIVTFLLLLWLPWVFLRSQGDRRAKAIDTQLIPFLDEVRVGLTTGTVEQSIRRAAKATQAPLSHELALLISDLDVGVPLDEALKNMANRSDSRSLVLTCVTLDMAARTGSPEVATNLHAVAEMLNSISGLRDKISSRTIQTRIVSKVVIALPIVTTLAVLFLGVEPWLTPLGLGVAIFLALAILGLRLVFKAMTRWMTEATV
jgi:tight adherence protein B